MKRLLPLLCLAPAAFARADWPADASVDVPVVNLDLSDYPSVVPDNQGGIFVIFSHTDSANSVTLRGEHFSAVGDRLWSTATPDGSYLGLDLLGLSLGTASSGKAMAVTDADGGFIAAYTPGGAGPWTLDFQRFDEAAAPEWIPTGLFGGVELLANPDYYSNFYIVPDSLGGALAVYLGSNGAYGQRVDSTGTADYSASYTFLNEQSPGPFYPTRFIGADGLGGMYFIWPNSGSAASDPVLSYLTPTGNLGFQVNSVAPLGSEFEAWGIAGLGDGGGAWASWWGNVGLAGSNIVVQQFLPDAGTVFDGGTQNGIQLAALPTTGDNPGVTLLGDGTGGVTAVWYAVAGGTGALYAQRLATDGGTLWGANPVLVSSAASTPQADDSYLLNFRLIAAPNGDPTVVWSGVSGGIYAEKIDLASGSKLWGSLSGGIKVSAVYQPAYMDVAYGTDDSAYVTYQDSLAHIYVKRIEPDGTLGGEVPDAGPLPDAGVDAGIDAGFDAGVDAGIDAGVDAGLDAGPEIDAGPDAGTVDAGPDAGTVDAGHVDAGLDAGEPVDAGQTPDAGNPTPDAGADGGTTVAAKSGCSCSSGDAGLSWSFALFLVAALRRRRANR